MTASFLIPVSEYPDPDARSRLLLSVLERAEELPGVDRAALVRREPGTGRTFTWLSDRTKRRKRSASGTEEDASDFGLHA